MPLRCSLMRHLHLRKGENAVNCNLDDPGVQQVGKPGELRAAGAYLGGGDRHSALSRLFCPGKAERKDRVQRAAGSQGTQKTAAGRPARRINDQGLSLIHISPAGGGPSGR